MQKTAQYKISETKDKFEILPEYSELNKVSSNHSWTITSRWTNEGIRACVRQNSKGKQFLSNQLLSF